VRLKRAERRFNLTTRDYAQLAAFRHALRGFLRFSEAAAGAAGLTGQHYQAMLVLRACPDERRVTINDLAQQLFIKHNSAVGLGRPVVLGRPGGARAFERRTGARSSCASPAGGARLLARLAAMHRREPAAPRAILKRFFAELERAG
jgi:hypothetical protein